MMQTATVNKPLKVYVAVKADFAADGTMCGFGAVYLSQLQPGLLSNPQ